MGDCMMPSPQQRQNVVNKIQERLKQRMDRIRRQSDSHNNSYEARMTAKNAHEQQDTERLRARYYQSKAKINKTNCNSRVKQEGGQLRTPKIEKDLNGDASCQPHPNLMKLLNSGQTPTTNNKRKRENSLEESDVQQLQPKRPNQKIGENVSSTSMSIDIKINDNKKTNVNVTISQQQETLTNNTDNDPVTLSPLTRSDNSCFVSDFFDGRIEFKDLENDLRRDPNQYKLMEKKLKELEEEWQKELIENYGIKSVDSKADDSQDTLINSTHSPGLSLGQVDGPIMNAISQDSPAGPQQNGAGGTYDMKGPPNTVATDVKTPTSETLPNIGELRPNQQQPNPDLLQQPIKVENQHFINNIARNSPKNPSIYKNPPLKREPMTMPHGQQNFHNALPSIQHAKTGMNFTGNMIKSEPLQNQQGINGMFQQQQQSNITIPGQAAPKPIFTGPGGRVFEDPQKVAQYNTSVPDYQADPMLPVNIDRTPNVTVPVRAPTPNILSNQQTQKKANLQFKQSSMSLTQQILRQPHQQQPFVNKLQHQQQLPNSSSLMMSRPSQKTQQMQLMMQYKQMQLQRQQQQQNPQLIQTPNMQVMNGRPPPRYEETRTMNNVVYQNNQLGMQQAQMARQNPNSMNPPDYRQTNAIQGMTSMPNQVMPVQHGQTGQTMPTLSNQQNTAMYNFMEQTNQGFQQQQHGQSIAMMRLANSQNPQLRPTMNRQNMLAQNANMLARGQMMQQQQRVWQGRNQVMNSAMSQSMLQATPQAGGTTVGNTRFQNAFNVQTDMQFQQQPNQNFGQAPAPTMNSNNVTNINMRQRFYPGVMANRQQQLNTNVQTTISMGAHQQPTLDQQLQVSTGVTAYGNPNGVQNTVNIQQNIMNNLPLGNMNPALHNTSKQLTEADLNDLEAILNPM